MNAPLHSRLSPSAASRWVHCTASVGFIEANKDKLPKEETTYADEGTKAHAVASEILTHALGQVADNPEMQAYVDEYCAWVQSLRFPGAKFLVEHRVSLFYLPEQFGTVDVGIYSPKKVIIADLKYGAGVGVYAERNAQLAIYAESLIQEIELVDEVPDSLPVEIYIYQPRDRNNPEPVREWKLTRGELREFCGEIINAAMNIGKGLVEFNADPERQCRFCRAKGLCTEYATFGLTELETLPTTEDALVPGTLTREQRVKILQSKSAMVAWLEAIEDQERADLERGEPPMGFKLVEGKSNRQWADEAAVAKLLKNYLTRDEVYKPESVISPAQAEKLLKGKETSTRFQTRLSSLITKPEGKPTLVPESDKRPALVLNPANELSAIADDDCI